MSDLIFLAVVFAPGDLPDTSGVYGIFSHEHGECLYIGKATRSLQKRLAGGHKMWREAQQMYTKAAIYYTEIDSDFVTYQEHGFIFHHNPIWNDGALASHKWKDITPEYIAKKNIDEDRKKIARAWIECIWRYLTSARLRPILRKFPYWRTIDSIHDLEEKIFLGQDFGESSNDVYFDIYPSLESSNGKKLPLAYDIVSRSISIPLPYLDALLRMTGGSSILCPNATVSYFWSRKDYYPEYFPDDESVLDRVRRNIETANKYVNQEFAERYKYFCEFWWDSERNEFWQNTTDLWIFYSYANHLWLWSQIWDIDILYLSQRQKIIFFNQFILKNPPTDAYEIFCNAFQPAEFVSAFYDWCQAQGFQPQYQNIKDKPDILRITKLAN